MCTNFTNRAENFFYLPAAAAAAPENPWAAISHRFFELDRNLKCGSIAKIFRN